VNLSGNTILITGGATGIGWAIAERFLKAGSKVILCGRREDKLRECQAQYPALDYRVCDVAKEADRIALVKDVTAAYPDLNVVVNNAGIQRHVRLAEDQSAWREHQQEIAINLEAPIHLAMLFAPHLAGRSNPVIINVTSGLAFAPLAMVPIYSATKAALHSFTQSLRYQLSTGPIEVIEVIPPAVNTDLGGPGLHTFGVPVDDFADGIMEGLAAGAPEVGYGTAAMSMRASRDQLDQAFQRMNPPVES
jgi:uncharacterized oxidoreductase